jgi:hypothetical protein
MFFMGSIKFINQEIKMCNSVHVDQNSIAAYLTGSNCGGFKKCYISTGLDGNDNDMLWNGIEEDGDVRSECEEDEGTVCKAGDSDTDW